MHFAIEGERKNKSYSKPKSKSVSKDLRRKNKNLSVDKAKDIKKKETKEIRLMEIEEI